MPPERRLALAEQLFWTARELKPKVNRFLVPGLPLPSHHRCHELNDDENQLIEMRTDTSATPTGLRWRTTWVYIGLGRERVRMDYTGSGSAWKGRSKKAE
jgi:hypothetical protein